MIFICDLFYKLWLQSDKWSKCAEIVMVRDVKDFVELTMNRYGGSRIRWDLWGCGSGFVAVKMLSLGLRSQYDMGAELIGHGNDLTEVP